MTVGQPGPGAMGEPCIDMSPSRAAGKPPMSTVTLPCAIPFGAGETQTMPPGVALATAAGCPPISTVANGGCRCDHAAHVGFRPVEERTERRVAGAEGGSGGHRQPAGGVTSAPVASTPEKHRVGVRPGGCPGVMHASDARSVLPAGISIGETKCRSRSR